MTRSLAAPAFRLGFMFLFSGISAWLIFTGIHNGPSRDSLVRIGIGLLLPLPGALLLAWHEHYTEGTEW
jgi:hypothetical protein